MPPTPDPAAARPGILVIGCGALGRELAQLARHDGPPDVEVRCLPAALHNRPERIAAAVDERIRAARGRHQQVFVAYADCGTRGALDRVLATHGVERLPGAHCYEVYAGAAAFARLADEEPGTFYLTDFLARNFERLVIEGLGIDRHPQLGPVYFAGYRRLVYLSQSDDPALMSLARQAAARLGLAFEHRSTGYGGLGAAVGALRAPARAVPGAAVPGAGVPGAAVPGAAVPGAGVAAGGTA